MGVSTCSIIIDANQRHCIGETIDIFIYCASRHAPIIVFKLNMRDVGMRVNSNAFKVIRSKYRFDWTRQ
mgnify:CR=1 FL=1